MLSCARAEKVERPASMTRPGLRSRCTRLAAGDCPESECPVVPHTVLRGSAYARIAGAVLRAAGSGLCLLLGGCAAGSAPTGPTPTETQSPSLFTPPPPSPPAPRTGEALIPLPPGAPPSLTTLVFESEPGEPIVRGTSRRYYLGDGNWTATYHSRPLSHVAISVDSFSGPPFWNWSLDFAPPPGDVLRPGVTYRSAQRYPFQGGSPGLDFSGTGTGCNTSIGQFTVVELAVAPDGKLLRFAANFEQRCTIGFPATPGPGLRGSVQIVADPWR